MLHIASAAPERAPEIVVDPYVPLHVTWPARGVLATRLWWRFGDARTMLELGFGEQSAELEDVTLVLPGPIARVTHGPPAAAPAGRGVPRCDPAQWAGRSASGAVRTHADHYVDDEEPLATELGAGHLLVRIGGRKESAAWEVACGPVRFGVSAAATLLWICVTGFSADERALLDEHAARSLRPPERMPPSRA